jgi:hypothetical protein
MREKEKRQRPSRPPQMPGDETPAELDPRHEEPTWGDEGGAGEYDGGPTTQRRRPKPER